MQMSDTLPIFPQRSKDEGGVEFDNPFFYFRFLKKVKLFVGFFCLEGVEFQKKILGGVKFFLGAISL